MAATGAVAAAAPVFLLLLLLLLAFAGGSPPPGTCAAKRGAGKGDGAAAKAWKGIESECRKKLEANKTSAAMRCLEGHFLEGREPGRRDGDWFTTLRKLRHDAEMFTWLEQEGKVKTEVKKLYRGIYHSARPQHVDKPDKVFEVKFQEQNDDRKLWQKAHNKAVYIDPSGKETPKKTVRGKTAKVEQEFSANGYAVADKILTDKALRTLKRFLQASTFYFYPRKDKHLMALLEDGLASPLLAQLSDGLRHALPSVLGPLPLTGARAWKADNSPLTGGRAQTPEIAGSSADAAVSVLLWMVPSSALNGTAVDAMGLSRREALEGFNSEDDDADLPELVTSIKYVSNRAVLWGPDLAPLWTGPGWKSGFLQRGVHLLLTFGWTRCEG